MRVPALTVALLVGSAAALLWFALTLAELTPFAYNHPGAMSGVAVFLVANAAMLCAAAHRIRSPRYGAERRRGARLQVALHGAVDEYPCRILDVSLTGARVRLLAPPGVLRQRARLRIDFVGGPAELTAISRWQDARDPSGVELGLGFAEGQRPAVARLALALLAAESSAEDAAPRDGGRERPGQPFIQPWPSEGRRAA